MSDHTDAVAQRKPTIADIVCDEPNDDPHVPIWHVVREIVQQALDAVDSSQTPHRLSLVKASAGIIRQHPRQIEIIGWLAQDGLEKALLDEADERGMNYYL
jgi:hypothetical protein